VSEAAGSKRGEVSGASFTRQDFMSLTKARLSILVIVTTVVGFLLASRSAMHGVDWGNLLHTVIGGALAAGAASVFNQLMEIDADARMNRTADRPLPRRKLPVAGAFSLGWLLAALGIIHLAAKVNFQASAIAAATLGIYIFIYTPAKRFSSLNTLVGAVAGALPPLIGWFAAGGAVGIEMWFLFALLFLWQLPHFLAINWMYRDEYEKAGFVMWSNGDESGARTSMLALIFSAALLCLLIAPLFFSFVRLWAVIGLCVAGILMLLLAFNFRLNRTRVAARKLFLYTLLFLPVCLGLLIMGWQP
jgi:protoheme IX farnesyltransferase